MLFHFYVNITILKSNNATPVARQGRKATGLKKTARLPFGQFGTICFFRQPGCCIYIS